MLALSLTAGLDVAEEMDLGEEVRDRQANIKPPWTHTSLCRGDGVA